MVVLTTPEPCGTPVPTSVNCPVSCENRKMSSVGFSVLPAPVRLTRIVMLPAPGVMNVKMSWSAGLLGVSRMTPVMEPTPLVVMLLGSSPMGMTVARDHVDDDARVLARELHADRRAGVVGRGRVVGVGARGEPDRIVLTLARD